MGKAISSLFTTQCYQCQGTGTDPEYQFIEYAKHVKEKNI
jgi:hypothetical protein